MLKYSKFDFLGLFCEESALFRHEVAYVLGQLQSPIAIPALKERLGMLEENGMVRHECAEALGSIATDECQQLLKQYLNDEEVIFFNDKREKHFEKRELNT